MASCSAEDGALGITAEGDYAPGRTSDTHSKEGIMTSASAVERSISESGCIDIIDGSIGADARSTLDDLPKFDDNTTQQAFVVSSSRDSKRLVLQERKNVDGHTGRGKGTGQPNSSPPQGVVHAEEPSSFMHAPITPTEYRPAQEECSARSARPQE